MPLYGAQRSLPSDALSDHPTDLALPAKPLWPPVHPDPHACVRRSPTASGGKEHHHSRPPGYLIHIQMLETELRRQPLAQFAAPGRRRSRDEHDVEGAQLLAGDAPQLLDQIVVDLGRG